MIALTTLVTLNKEVKTKAKNGSVSEWEVRKLP